MEHTIVSPYSVDQHEVISDSPATGHNTFIEANTIPMHLDEMKDKHTIPVFIDNEPVISHVDFIELTQRLVADQYYSEQIRPAVIKVSHPILGRLPEAKHKPVKELVDSEKTLYYQRMMFAIEVPSIQDTIDGNTLSLMMGGVKSYHLDNLYTRNISDQHFKFFIGFKNHVCLNLCVWTDGFAGDLKVTSLNQLAASISTILKRYNESYHLFHLKQLVNYSITEQQFAQFVGRCRMYHHLPNPLKKEIPNLLFGDTQLGTVCKDFYKDQSFCRQEDGSINLWRLYNLFTGSNKNSYIDSFLERGVNAFHLVEQIRLGLENKQTNWYLS